MQGGLLNWFWLSPQDMKKLPAIENVCNKLHQQYFPDSQRKPKYEVFYPLLRYGLIEFYGGNSFCLSPSTAIFNDQCIALINVPDRFLNIKVAPILETNLGIFVYPFTAGLLSSIKEVGIATMRYDLASILKRLPSLDSLVNSWKDDTVHETSNFQFFTDRHKWSTDGNAPLVGVYRKSNAVYSAQGVKVSGNKWKVIPTRAEHVDSFNIAILWKQVKNTESLGVKFQPVKQQLFIENIFFPIILERLFFLNTILQPSGNGCQFKRIYTATSIEYKLLNRYLSGQIKTL